MGTFFAFGLLKTNVRKLYFIATGLSQKYVFKAYIFAASFQYNRIQIFSPYEDFPLHGIVSSHCGAMFQKSVLREPLRWYIAIVYCMCV